MVIFILFYSSVITNLWESSSTWTSRNCHSGLCCLVTTGQKKSKYLAVSNFRVPVGVGSEDSAQSRDSCVTLKCRVLWQRAVQVSFNLVCSQSACAQRLFNQLSVIAGVSGHVVHGSYRDTNHSPSKNSSCADPAPPFSTGLFMLSEHLST